MASRAFERALNEELAGHGITHRQWQVLAWLALEGELTQSQIAERLRVAAPTIVGILDRMERKGWIRREPAPGDRRKKLVRPLSRVRPVWDRIRSCGRRLRSEATRGLKPGEVRLARAVLAGVLRNLEGRGRNGDRKAST
ncbi:MAG: MarR family transcriptional regulator [Planctomycetes bacterium]|nr:MarR family transcriptional regulator [Planctomycetota bacterium]